MGIRGKEKKRERIDEKEEGGMREEERRNKGCVGGIRNK